MVNVLNHRDRRVDVNPKTFDVALERNSIIANCQVLILGHADPSRDPTARASVLSLFNFNLLPVSHLPTANALLNVNNHHMKVRWS